MQHKHVIRICSKDYANRKAFSNDKG